MFSISTILKRFRRDERGNLALIFAGAIVPVGVLLGTSYDFGRAFNAREAMQQTLDAAVFAAGREFDQTASLSKAEEVGRRHFAAALPDGIDATVTSFSGDGSGNITMKASADVDMTFLRIAGTNTMDVSVDSSSLTEDQGGMNLELAIVFDVTGSMGDNNKMEAARAAALDLVDILLPPGYSGARSVRISLVPFSAMVNLGSYASAATNLPSAEYRLCTAWKSNGNCKTWGSWKVGTTNVTGSQNVQKNFLKSCTVERMDAANGGSDAIAYGDTPPGANAWFRGYTTSSSSSTSCTPIYPIVPLTSERDAVLIPAINALEPSGSTAGHLGTAWGWYTISPNWASFWPEANRPADADPRLMKAVIIMTDGIYNTHYTASGSTVAEDSWQTADPNAANGYSRTQALAICSNMKAQGVEVFAVGVELPSDAGNTARNTLESCVTSPNHLFERHFYDVIDSWNVGDGLSAAFSDIGNKIAVATGTGNSRLRLTR